jgi:hypothetical protein
MGAQNLLQSEQEATVRKVIFMIANVLFGAATAHAAPATARAANVVVGVNVAGVQRMNQQQQDALIEKLRAAGVNTVRTGVSNLAPAESLINFVTNAYKRGIGTILIVNPTEGGTGLHTQLSAERRHTHQGRIRDDPDLQNTG